MKSRLLISFFFALAFFAPHASYAATLSAIPASQSVTVGNIATVHVLVNAGGTAINNAEAVLNFPSDVLQVVSIDKSSSIFTLWVEDPTFSNDAGTVSFNGGLPNPGYQGSSGSIVSVTFIAKKAGTATIKISNGVVRANDGFGTNVLSGSIDAQIVVSAPQTQSPTPIPVVTLPPSSTPTQTSTEIASITSTTHPDQNAWYANNTAELSWTLPQGTVAVETIVNENAPTVPSVVYKPAITSKSVTDLADGTWYFSLRTRTGSTWGPISTYRLQIDTTPPILENPGALYDASNHTLTLSNITATDVTSGVSFYEVSVDGGASTTIPAQQLASSTQYELPYQGTEGNHTVLLVAVDRASNRTTAHASFAVAVPLGDQVVWNVFGVDITLLGFLLTILLISLIALLTSLVALYKSFKNGRARAAQISKRDQTLHRAITLFKDDLKSHLSALKDAQTKRDLTAEEEKIHGTLSGNLDDLERYLKKEIKKFD